jgi:hypothetical protein|uniref:Uncharacterized protein n=1 Tax=viral metagenome TaxID=1070528 RepID=A0A6C0CC76_9ZZZZ
MCWNEAVSLNTFLFSLFGISFAYFNNVINGYEYLFYYSFISIQLVEYFTWKHLNNKKINRLLSQLGLFLISMQPIMFILSVNNVEYIKKLQLISVFSIFWLFTLFYFSIDFSMTKAPNGHLAWHWLNVPPLYIFIWLTFFLVILLYIKKYILFAIHLIVFLAIYYTYYKTKTWGSLWCWIANIMAVFLIVRTFFKSSIPNYLVINETV